MNHADHVNLIQNGLPAYQSGTLPPIWADLGSGHGAFTLALADLLPPGAVIYSVDRDASALREQERTMRARFPRADVRYLPADFTRPLKLPPLDGVLMANSLHFHPHKEPILLQIKSLLNPEGRLILVEYDTERGNTWVPYPLSYRCWEKLATQNGFLETTLMASYPSRFLGRIYSAISKISK